MSAISKYKIVDSGRIFSFTPNRHSVKLSVWTLGVILSLVLLAIIFFRDINRGMVILLTVLGPYLILHSLYDIFIRAEICYVFDREDRIVYIEKPLFPTKKIMSFEEIVIFTSTTGSYWHYAIGAKNNHLVKSYRISEDFREGRKKSSKESAYENAILAKLYEMRQLPVR
ncbi:MULTISPECIES: hypothetical protein [unclassified Sphingobacterium]|uniref:hypothetical protein n=1 Tax=unclassified Sphingobacterium TaxID=2609468 RepID=UPI0025D52F8A|nr:MULTISPECIES: hypothetical protein [unclassified Sphingobacterium]